jgi:hypothetical protein
MHGRGQRQQRRTVPNTNLPIPHVRYVGVLWPHLVHSDSKAAERGIQHQHLRT